MGSDAWNARYASALDLVWTGDPNPFAVQEMAGLPPGRALDLAAAEGRNAVWLAARGWQVTAVDFSQVAIDRRRQLASNRGVDVTWVVADSGDEIPPPGRSDAVLVVYLHLSPQIALVSWPTPRPPWQSWRASPSQAKPEPVPPIRSDIVTGGRTTYPTRGRRRGLVSQRVELVLRLARENPRWGYLRIVGECRELGVGSQRPWCAPSSAAIASGRHPAATSRRGRSFCANVRGARVRSREH